MTRALISVSNKDGLTELAKAMVDAGVELVSTGGTARHLSDAGLPVTDVSEVTGFPEVLDGRVKTLHPNLHAGLLARRDLDSHVAALQQLQIEPIDYVIVNLYPFQGTIEKPGVTLEQAVEQIDIGGPSMLRAAAKNHEHVVVVVDSADYARVIESLTGGAAIDRDERLRLATKVFRHTAAYDSLVAQYLSGVTGEEFPERLTVTYEKVQDLRYGENPHQGAAFYAAPGAGAHTIAGARQLQGKELSYNNISDANAALAIAAEFDAPVAVAVKHTNPCGVGIGAEMAEAFARANAADPVSIFGGVIACNRTVDLATARQMSELFLEIVLAPSFDEDALELFAAKPNLRVLEVSTLLAGGGDSLVGGTRTTAGVAGGLLVQHLDTRELTATDLQVVTAVAPTDEQLLDLLFGWRVVKHVKSNAVVLAGGGQTLGIGAGQMNRVGAARIAIEAAGPAAIGSVLASDAFFPMPDTVEQAAAAGISAIIQPGGSKRDGDSIAACDAAGIAMVFTGVRHFKH